MTEAKMFWNGYKRGKEDALDEFTVCDVCNNLTMDGRHPEGFWGPKYCTPCCQLSIVTGIPLHELMVNGRWYFDQLN